MCANIYACVCVCVSQHGEPLSPAASSLAMVLTRGLSMEQQKSSRDSLQYSSGYSTQTNTPSCSEDTIPSQGNPPPHAHTVCQDHTHAICVQHSISNWLCVIHLCSIILPFSGNAIPCMQRVYYGVKLQNSSSQRNCFRRSSLFSRISRCSRLAVTSRF